MNKYKNNPNQRTIKIQKEPCDKKNKYIIVNLEALQLAMQNLTNAQFKVGMFLAKNANNYNLEVSPAEIAVYGGIKKTTMQETIRFFIKAGYLVPIDNSSTYYTFYEIPEDVDKS